MDIKLNFVPAPKISNSDVKYKGFHPREKSNYVKFVNNEMKEIHDEYAKIIHKVINEQQNYICKIKEEFYKADSFMGYSLKTGEIDTEKYISNPIFKGTESVFNSMMEQMKLEFEKISREGNKTLDEKKAKAKSILKTYPYRVADFYDFLKYLHKTLYLTCFNILRMFWALPGSIADYIKTFIEDKFGIHSNYLFLSKQYLLNDYLPEVLEKEITPKYRSFFTTGLSSLISACFEEYKTTYEKSSSGDIQKFAKKKFKEQEKEIGGDISSTLNKEIPPYMENKLKSIMSKKQKRKVFQLNGQIGEALDIIFQKSASLTKKNSLTEEQNKKILELKKALSDLSDILVSKKGKLTNEQIQLFDKVFKGVRNTKGTSYKLSETEIGYLKKVYHEGDGPTARIIINLFSMITDNGDKMLTAIKEYVDELLQYTYPTYDCTKLIEQIKEGKKLLKIESINSPGILGLLNTLDILKRILKGETPFFSSIFKNNITHVFKIDYEQVKIEDRSNNFFILVKGKKQLIQSKNSLIQRLILGFLEKTTADKNFIVNKIKEQIAKSKPVKSEPTESKSTEPESTESRYDKPESTESGSDKPESTESGSDKPESTESGSGKGKRRRKKKKRK